MGDPGLGAVDDIGAAFQGRAGSQRCEVGARIGLGEDGCRQDLAASDLRKVFLPLLLCSADEDQFGGDLRARAERADADIAARQFLGHDAHRDLAEAHPAVGLGDRQAKDAHFRKPADDFERDVGVGPVPGLGVGNDLRLGEPAHFARIASNVSSSPGSPIAPSGASPMIAASAARFSAVLPDRISVSIAGSARHGRHRRPTGQNRRDARSRPGSSECRQKSGPDIHRGRSGSSRSSVGPKRPSSCMRRA